MFKNETSTPVGPLPSASDAELLVENFKVRYGIARPITRQLISDFGLSLPKIFEELKRLGYPVPVDE